jgi:hypothetical protein
MTTPLTEARAAGLITRAEALAQGYDDKAIKRLLRSKSLARVRNGAYLPYPIWAESDLFARHRYRAIAVSLKLGSRVALSHVTAAALLGMDLWNAPLDDVHVTRLDGATGRHERGLVHHEGRLLPEDCVNVDGLLLTAPARTVLDTAALVGQERGLVVADSALHRGLTSVDELAAVHSRMARWPGTLNCHMVVRLADGRAESPGETRVRHLCFRHGLPLPILQYEVRDARGQLIGICDFAWPEYGVIGEFDGKVKYGELVAPGKTPTDVLFAEKRREDRIREVTGFRVIRMTWSDLERPHALVARLRGVLHGAA